MIEGAIVGKGACCLVFVLEALDGDGWILF